MSSRAFFAMLFIISLTHSTPEAAGEAIVLKDGTCIVGKLSARTRSNIIIVLPNGKTRNFYIPKTQQIIEGEDAVCPAGTRDITEELVRASEPKATPSPTPLPSPPTKPTVDQSIETAPLPTEPAVHIPPASSQSAPTSRLSSSPTGKRGTTPPFQYEILSKDLKEWPTRREVHVKIFCVGDLVESNLQPLLEEINSKTLDEQPFGSCGPTHIVVSAYASRERTSGLAWIARSSWAKESRTLDIHFQLKDLGLLMEEPTDRFGLTENQRKRFYWDLIAAGWRATQEEEIMCPPEPEAYRDAKCKNLYDRLIEKYSKVVLDRYNISKTQRARIVAEGVRKGWPEPEPEPISQVATRLTPAYGHGEMFGMSEEERKHLYWRASQVAIVALAEAEISPSKATSESPESLLGQALPTWKQNYHKLATSYGLSYNQLEVISQEGKSRSWPEPTVEMAIVQSGHLTGPPVRFHGIEWGSPRVSVVRSVGDPGYKDGLSMAYAGQTVANFPCNTHFLFLEGDRLATVTCELTAQHFNPNLYLEDYADLKKALSKKYGDAFEEQKVWKNDLFRDDPEQLGTAISLGHVDVYSFWRLADTTIGLTMSGDMGSITHCLIYQSVPYSTDVVQEHEKRMVDDL